MNPEVEVAILRNATVDLEVYLFGFYLFEVDFEAEREGNTVYENKNARAE